MKIRVLLVLFVLAACGGKKTPDAKSGSAAPESESEKAADEPKPTGPAPGGW